MFKIKKIPPTLFLIVIGLLVLVHADEDKDITIISGTSTTNGKSTVRKGMRINTDGDKDITVISGTSTADGESTVRKEVLEECIRSLPQVSELEAQVSSESRYLKAINGDLNKNEFRKTYTAQIEINYILFQKVLIIITTNSIQGQEPITKIVEKRLKQSKSFESNSSEGDIFANRSHRQYFFSSPEKAIEDVKKRAKTWLNQQAAVVCNTK